MFEDVEQLKILNEVFKEFDEEESYDKFLYDDILKLANIILNSQFPLVMETEEEYKDINESIRDAYEFFLSINSSYAERFLNILNEPEIKNNQEVGKKVKFIFTSNEKDKAKSGIKNNGNVNIICFHTLEDVETIVHEISHKLSTPTRIDLDDVCEGTMRDFFGEVSSITMEFLLYEFLKQKNSNKEALNLILKRIDDTYQMAVRMMLENQLYLLYKQNNNLIDKNIITNYIKKNDLTEYSMFYQQCIDDIVQTKQNDNENMIFKEIKSYILGVLYGAYFYNSYYKQDKNSLKTLFVIIDELGTNDYTIDKCLQRLTKIKFPGVYEEGIDIDDNLLELFQYNLNQFEQYINHEFEQLEQQVPKM